LRRALVAAEARGYRRRARRACWPQVSCAAL